MRGAAARELRQITRQLFTDRPVVEYEYREIIHGGVSQGMGTTRYLVDGCLRAIYHGAKRTYKTNV